MTTRRLILLLAVSALVAAGCGTGGAEQGADAEGGHAAGEHDHDDATHDPVEGAREVVVTATDLDFEPESLTMDAGEAVNVQVVNEGELFHDFTLDEPALHVGVEPGETQETSLAIDEPGTYEAVCTVPGHEEAGMVVTIEVE